MQDDQGGRADLECADADLAGIDRGVVDGAGMQELVADQLVLGVEVQGPKLLDVAVCRQRAAIVDDLLVGLELWMKPLGQRGSGHRDAERLCGLDGGDAGLAEPDGAERVGAGREDAGGRAEGFEQDPGEVPGFGFGVRSRQQELEKLAVVDGLAAGAEKSRPQVVERAAFGLGR